MVRNGGGAGPHHRLVIMMAMQVVLAVVVWPNIDIVCARLTCQIPFQFHFVNMLGHDSLIDILPLLQYPFAPPDAVQIAEHTHPRSEHNQYRHYGTNDGDGLRRTLDVRLRKRRQFTAHYAPLSVHRRITGYVISILQQANNSASAATASVAARAGRRCHGGHRYHGATQRIIGPILRVRPEQILRIGDLGITYIYQFITITITRRVLDQTPQPEQRTVAHERIVGQLQSAQLIDGHLGRV